MEFTDGTNNRKTHKDAIFDHIPPSVNQGLLFIYFYSSLYPVLPGPVLD